MRILQIGGTFVGAQKEIEYGIHRFLKNKGDESYILYAIGESDDPHILKYETRFDNIVRRGLTKVFGKNSRFAFLGTLRILHFKKKINPDLINIHILHHGYVDYSLLLRFISRKKIPVVYTMHDFWAYTGGCYHYTNLKCTGYQSGCISCKRSKAELDCKPSRVRSNFIKKKRLFEKINKLAFVSVSSWVHDEIMQSPISKYPQYTVWNAIKIPDAHIIPKTYEKKSQFKIIGVATNWDNRKGILDFIELARLLGNDFEILLVGNATPSIKAASPDNIKYLGMISDKNELYRYYADCDLHVSMSKEETFGLTFIEAACVGTRSMGFNSSAIPYVLEKIDGIIIDSNQIKDMVDKIKYLSDRRELCKLDNNKIEEIRKYFSVERMVLMVK